ncbi:UDP-glucose 4-epimerase GalE, partial [Escherichia coli]|nr:UDP-glucose 4-epimerase GalE [Escherichia coli]
SILVTGGCGYIGIHTVYTLISQGYSVVVLDNLTNSTMEPLRRVEFMTNRSIPFYEGDVGSERLLEEIFIEHHITSIIHFAGLKSVSESILNPVEYYLNNVAQTLSLLNAMIKNNIKDLIFSSSATVYGKPENCPITESENTGGTTNPYGTSKYIMELILSDVCKAYHDLNITVLRYFNPIGAHESGNIGEHPNGVPNNLFPYLTQVAIGAHPYLNVLGSDYPTPDGTGVRDYIHVMDLAEAHVKALLRNTSCPGLKTYNLGTGKGYSVFDIIREFEVVTGVKIPYKVMPRRNGDVAECWSDSSKANKELQWTAKRDLKDMIRDAWHWQSKNPHGYDS